MNTASHFCYYSVLVWLDLASDASSGIEERVTDKRSVLEFEINKNAKFHHFGEHELNIQNADRTLHY
jgi:hypothetical protein